MAPSVTACATASFAISATLSRPSRSQSDCAQLSTARVILWEVHDSAKPGSVVAKAPLPAEAQASVSGNAQETSATRSKAVARSFIGVIRSLMLSSLLLLQLSLPGLCLALSDFSKRSSKDPLSFGAEPSCHRLGHVDCEILRHV